MKRRPLQPTLPVLLADATVRLEPLGLAHVDGLVEAAAVRDTYGLTRVPLGAEATASYVAQALEEQERGASIPLATVDAATGRVVGSTRFMTIERWRWRRARSATRCSARPSTPTPSRSARRGSPRAPSGRASTPAPSSSC